MRGRLDCCGDSWAPNPCDNADNEPCDGIVKSMDESTVIALYRHTNLASFKPQF